MSEESKECSLLPDNIVYNTINAIKDFGHVLESITERMDFLYDEVQKSNLKSNDLRHEIENGKFDVFKGYNKLNEYKKLLNYRRCCKNEYEILEKFKSYVDSHKWLVTDLFKALKEVERELDRHVNWSYKQRINEETV
jgi:hypothetical protein